MTIPVSSQQAFRPRFSHPPLFEQAIAVVFDSVPAFSLGDFGLFWQEIRGEFGTCEAQPLVPAHMEQFGTEASVSFQLQLVPTEPLPRCFYRNAALNELVQVQRDRFGFNWLKENGATYPHSEETVGRFFALFDRFGKFALGRGFGPLQVRQCEITNVNIIPATDVGDLRNVKDYIRSFPTMEAPNFLELESANYMSQHRILDDTGNAIGRLYQTCAPAVRRDTMEQAYRLELTARGAPIGAGEDGIRSFFEVARTAINAAFMSATSEKAHELWGYSDGNGI